MGANTYREFTKPMHGHTNYVATNSTEPLLPGFVAVQDVAAFFREHQDERINDIGGAGLFATTLQYADELVLTQIEQDFHCTKFFPEYTAEFVLVERSESITENGIRFRFETWRRKSAETRITKL